MAATLTMTPDPVDILVCKGRLIKIIVTVTDDTNPIPAKTTITVSASPVNKVNFQGANERVLVTPTGAPNTAIAAVYFAPVAYKAAQGADNSLVFTASTSIAGTPPIRQTYQIIDKAVIKYGVMDKNYLPAAPSDNLLPTDEDYTVSYSISVFEADGVTPISGYLVDLRQERPMGLFFNKLRFFYHEDDTVPATAIQGAQEVGSFLRTATDNAGQITYYLVATSASLYCRLRLLADWINPRPIGTVLVADLDISNVNYSAPMMEVSSDFGGTYLLDSVAGPSVKVDIPSSHNLGPGNIIFGFINGKLAFDTLYSGDVQVGTYGYVAKADIYSDFGEHAREYNELGYVISTQAGDFVTTSPFLEFTAKGGGNSNQPQEVARDVPAPVIPESESYINSTILNNPIVNLRVKLTPVPTWAPIAGHVLVASIYLNGYYPGTDMPKQGYKKADPYSITEDDITNGYANIPFDSDLFVGYDSSYSAPSRSGVFYAEYDVRRSFLDVTAIHVSNIYKAWLDTVPPGAQLKEKNGKSSKKNNQRMDFRLTQG